MQTIFLIINKKLSISKNKNILSFYPMANEINGGQPNKESDY